MNYKATFGIDYGVSYGLDLKFPDYLEIEKNLIAENDFKALLLSTGQALRFSRDYPNNPETKFTTVTLIELHNEYQNLINPKETLKREGYTDIKNFKWDKKKQIIYKIFKIRIFKHDKTYEKSFKI